MKPHGNGLLFLFDESANPDLCPGSGRMGIVELSQLGGGIIDDPEDEGRETKR